MTPGTAPTGLEENRVLCGICLRTINKLRNDAGNTIAVHIAREDSGKIFLLRSGLLCRNDEQTRQRSRCIGSNFVNRMDIMIGSLHYGLWLALIVETYKNVLFAKQQLTVMQNGYWESGEPRFWQSKNRLLNKKVPNIMNGLLVANRLYYSGRSLPDYLASKDGLALKSVVMKSVSICNRAKPGKCLNTAFQL